VPRSATGLSLTEGPKIDFLKPSPHCGLKLAACRVPAAAMLGPADGAYEAMALPFRDVEDAVGTAGLVGNLRFIARNLAQATDDATSTDAAAALGELVALTGVLAESSRAVVAALEANRLNQGDAPAVIVGIRALTAHILGRVQAFRAAHGTRATDNLDTLLRDLDKSLSIAKGPRLVKQTRLGSALFEKRS
jgi:acyl-CoA dehydrogenase